MLTFEMVDAFALMRLFLASNFFWWFFTSSGSSGSLSDSVALKTCLDEEGLGGKIRLSLLSESSPFVMARVFLEDFFFLESGD